MKLARRTKSGRDQEDKERQSGIPPEKLGDSDRENSHKATKQRGRARVPVSSLAWKKLTVSKLALPHSIQRSSTIIT
jgi:hypothetical protein